MAEVPAELDQQPPASRVAYALPGGDFLRGASNQPVVRQLGLLVALAASVAVGVSAVLWMRTPDYRPLVSIESAYQVNEITAFLDQHKLPYKIDEVGGMLLVSRDDLYEARMKLAGAELIDGRQLGYELLDKEQGFGVSQIMEQALLRRSVEGELARSIATITAVQNARVLLATPKTTTFLRDRRKPSASVTVTLLPGRELDNKQIRGISSLVAGAVPELDPANVAVVDQSGKLLSLEEEDPTLAQSEREMNLKRKHEEALLKKLANILIPIVGPDRYTAEVTADFDFSRIEQADEIYGPDQRATRSEQLRDEERIGINGPVGVPGALSNQPPAVAAAPEALQGGEENPGAAGPRQLTKESTRNFELDKTLTYTRHQLGQLLRLTVSVVVDDMQVINDETQTLEYQPWEDGDLERISESIKSAIGYSVARGDRVNVVNAPFYVAPPEAITTVPFWQETWFAELIKQTLGGLVLLILVFGLLRPLYKRLSSSGAQVAEDQRLSLAHIGEPGDPIFDDELERIPAPKPGESALLPVANTPYSSKVETIRGIVDENPGRVAQVVRHWVNDGE